MRRALNGDMLAAVAGFELACKHDERSACTDLAVALSRGEGVTKDTARATSLLTTSCSAGDAKGCTTLGAMLAADGKAKEAIAPLKSGCDLGNKKACELLDGACTRNGIVEACR